MRDRFLDVVADALDRDPRVAVVLAEIDVGRLRARGALKYRHPQRVINVGIREQLMVSVSGRIMLEGFRSVVESYAPFAVERPFQQTVDLGHLDVGAVLVSIAASYDASEEGRTHQAPAMWR